MRKMKLGSITRNTKARRDRSKAQRKSRRPSRDELLAEAETLGLDQLGWIHGGAESAFACCGWGTVGNCTRQGCGK